MTRNYDGVCLTLVSNYGKMLDGFRMPKGAVYGKDKDGLFICYDYKVRKWVTWRNKYGGEFPMPVLKMWRKVKGKWKAGTEVNYTTDAIIDWFESGDYPEVDWGDEKVHVSTKGVHIYAVTDRYHKFAERILPKGALYGNDKQGIFICLNIKPKGFKGGLPIMELWRPDRSDKRQNSGKWKKTTENNATSYAVWEMVKKHNLKISDRQAIKDLTENQELRADYGTVHYSNGGGWSSRPTATTICAYSAPRSLDELAEIQRNRPVFLGSL